MRVLVACEYSGRVRDAFLKRGHDAISCDLLPTDVPGPHYQGDVRDIINDGWDLMVCHPECTYLTVSGLHWNERDPVRKALTEDALDFVRYLLDCSIPKIALENPVGCISTRIRKPDQIIQPYEFGEDASKKTCLWLKNLSLLPIEPFMRYPGRIVTDPRTGKQVERWSNQTDSGQNRLPPSKDRWKIRSETYRGIATAMAEAWG
ncbi:MAG: DNA cytosine methyltransferase [Hyphomicrobiaceae bacterium]|nr:MAG: DNA cytosine methyltransferase [Hyphomicrobiaceae bacterium]